ncbi:MAG TPA: molybdate ABC transporter substrate-binding protein [Candidatus Deferrimicrobiaceae bacterium]
MSVKLLGAAVLIFALALLPTAVRAGQIYVSAAASLKEVVNVLADRYEMAHLGVKCVRNFGASGALAKQIEAGAPADLFLSANREWMDELQREKAIDPGSIGTLAHNVLVFAGKEGVRAGGMKDLPGLARVAIGSPKSVPAGEYAVQAMNKSGIAGPMVKKLVMARDVREAMLYAERGEVDGAFVYRTDAIRSKVLKVLFVVPQELYDRVTYPCALTVSGAKKPDALAFFAFLRSDAAKAVLEKQGFVIR